MIDKLRFPKFAAAFDTLHEALAKADKQPAIGVTQGGSSRDDRGAKVAATTAVHHQPKPRSI